MLKIRTILAIVVLAVLAGCSHKEMQPVQPHVVDVHVLFSYDGFCNISYNDLVLQGIERCSKKYGFSYSFYVPESIEDGMSDYRKWCSNPMEEGTEKALYIFASNIYEDALAQEEHPDPSTGKEILIFETDKELPYAYSFGMSYYGTSYLTSRKNMNPYWGMDFYIIAANPYMYGLQQIVDAINAAIEEQGAGTTTIKYLHDEKGQGLTLQKWAIALCYTLYKEENGLSTIFVPVGGMSNLGVYRFVSNHMSICWGVDLSDLSFATYIACAMHKRMDLALYEFFDRWLAGEEVPRNRFYTMESGKVTVTYDEDSFENKEILDSMIAVAIEKEKEYYRNMGR